MPLLPTTEFLRIEFLVIPNERAMETNANLIFLLTLISVVNLGCSLVAVSPDSTQVLFCPEQVSAQPKYCERSRILLLFRNSSSFLCVATIHQRLQSCANSIGYELNYGYGFEKNRIFRFRLRFRMSFHHFELFDYGFEDFIRISNYLITVSKIFLEFRVRTILLQYGPFISLPPFHFQTGDFF